MPTKPPTLRLATVLAALVLLAGCSFSEYRRAQVAEEKGDWDQAVLDYLSLTQRHPDDVSFRASLLRAKIRASQAHFAAGKKLADAGAIERAMVEYRQAVELDPTNQYAATELGKVRDAIAAREKQQGELKTIDEMKKEAAAKSQPPLLEPRSTQPISLDFPNPVSIKDIYKALGKAFGINILFDPNLKDQEIAIELKDVTAQDALEILMRAANHFYKVLDPHTILVAADTPQNRRAYEDLVIQTFYLSNSDVKDVMTMLRTLVDAKKIAANERLNAIIVRDSIDRVKVAQKLIETNDKARAEVVVDVELLQIDEGNLLTLGMNWPTSLAQSLNGGLDSDNTATGTQLNLNDLRFLNRGSWTFTIPGFVYDFAKQESQATVLAKPQLRISEGEKAALLIGDKVPIPTTTFNTSNTVGSNIVPITSFQYQDVGIKINIEPRVHHNLEVTLKMHVEVSNLGKSVDVGNGQSQPTISTRSLDTVIRLKDGETNFLAGLLRTDDSTGNAGLPGLSDLPLIGRLFSHDNRTHSRTDVVLTMTPHIIRRSDITEQDLMPIWVGTEQNITFRGGSPRVESDVEGPFDEGSSAADRVRELIRQRVQELPPGLDEEGNGEDENGAVEAPAPQEEPQPGAPQPPAGTNLVPPSFPDAQPAPTPTQPEQPPPPRGQAMIDGTAAPAPTTAARKGTGVTLRGASMRVEPDSSAPFATSAGKGGVVLTAAEPATAHPGASKVRLHFLPAAAAMAAGEKFDLRLEGDARAPLSHLPLVVTYDPQLVEPVSWGRGELLGGDGEAELLGAIASPGRLLLGVSRLGDKPGVTGTGTVAQITFVAKRPGLAQIQLEHPKAMGPGLQDLGPVAAQGARLRITPADGNDGAAEPQAKDGPHA